MNALMKYPGGFNILAIIFLTACSVKQPGRSMPLKELPHAQHLVDTVGAFSDSTNIGQPGFNKIYLASVIIDDSIPKSCVRFYARKDSGWKLTYAFEDEQWLRDVLEPEIVDFNNDGYKDITYLKGTGGRGGNSILNLFIYDKKGDSLTYVTNSNDFPNLYYNKETNSINSYILTGGTETVFMHLKNDTLIPFASIFQDDKTVTVRECGKDGKYKVIYIDSTNNYESMERFVNYKPLKVEKR